MSFYRKYRPQVFEEIDNIAIREKLLSLLTKDKKDLPHAFLFSGPKGAGKTTSARLIAKLFNCDTPLKSGAPCGKCDNCKAIADGRFLDVLELDAASNRGIDEIRQLRDTIALTPSAGKYKVYIIDEVHMLTTEAFNALLKTLEEPPVHAIFILATTDPQKVPATIKSRCVHYVFGRAKPDELDSALKRIMKEEKISIEADGLEVIRDLSDGAFRDAIKFLEQLSFHKGKVTGEVARKILAASEEKVVDSFLSALKEKDVKKSLIILEKFINDGGDVKAFLIDVLSALQEKLVASGQADDADLIRRFTAAYGELRISPIPRLPVELAVVEYCGVGAGDNKQEANNTTSAGLLTLEKLTDHWSDFIAAVKPFNNSIAGVLRSARPKSVENNIVEIEAFYSFHKEKLSESKTCGILEDVLKKLFGEKVKVEVALGKK